MDTINGAVNQTTRNVTGTIYSNGRAQIDTTLTIPGMAADANATGIAIRTHAESIDNPHNVTPKQIGLGNVDNTSDMAKPVSVAQEDAIQTAKSEAMNNASMLANNVMTVAQSAKTAAQSAQDTADTALANAQTANTTALKNTGGTMSGSIEMSGNKITGSGDPTEDGDLVHKKYVDEKHLVFTATIIEWTDNKATLTISGLVESDNAHVTPVYSDSAEDNLKIKEAWNMVTYADVQTDSITFVCLEDVPTVNIPILIEVNR